MESRLSPASSAEAPVGSALFEADVDGPAPEMLREAGATWAKTRVLWKLVQADSAFPARYDWSASDHLVGESAAAGLRNLTVVYANPRWVTERECLPVPAEYLRRYGDFFRAMVERYDGDGVDDAPNGATVNYWQISNEVDFDPTAESGEGDYGGCAGNDPTAYAEQLVTAYRAAKLADPEAQVGVSPMAFDRFTAASAPPGWSAPPGPFVYGYMTQLIGKLYQAHADDADLPFFDFVSLHNYNDNGHFWDGEGGMDRELVGKARAFRETQLMVPGVADLRGLPLYVTETGLASAPSDEWTERSEALQAEYVGQTLVRGLAAGAKAVLWYTARDNIMGDCTPSHYDWLTFGLMRSTEYRQALSSRCPEHTWMDLDNYEDSGRTAARPALGAFATAARFLAGAAFAKPLSLDEVGTSPSSGTVEAYGFQGPDGSHRLAVWTTTGERLGKRDVPEVKAEITIDDKVLRPWTGRVRVTRHLGEVKIMGTAGQPTVQVEVGEAPLFLETVLQR